MHDSPDTRDSLIIRIRRSSDGDAWDEFVGLYRPVVYRLARRRGMQDADAQDLAQQVMIAVAKAIERWERRGDAIDEENGDGRRVDGADRCGDSEQAIGIPREKGDGHFRRWLSRVAKNAIVNALTRGPRDRAGGGTTAIELLRECPQPDGASAEAVEWELRRELFRRAAREVRGQVDPATWQGFWMTTVEGRSVEETAAAIGRSLGSVYAARSRVMRRLREEVKRICERDERGDDECDGDLE